MADDVIVTGIRPAGSGFAETGFAGQQGGRTGDGRKSGGGGGGGSSSGGGRKYDLANTVFLIAWEIALIEPTPFGETIIRCS